MAANIEQELIEKVRALPDEKKQEVLDFAEGLAAAQTHTNEAKSPMTIWNEIEDIISAIPNEAWDELPTDGSLNLDHYLYGAPKKQ